MSVEDDAKALALELDWLGAVLDARFARLGGKDGNDPLAIVPPDLPASALARHVDANTLNVIERLILALALARHVRPTLLDPLFITNSATGRAFTEFGGGAGRAGAGFQPSGETAAFLVAGEDLAARLRLMSSFASPDWARRIGVLPLARERAVDPWLAGALHPAGDILQHLTGGMFDDEAGLPAHRLTTPLGWDDVVLGADVRAEIDTILGWLRHGPQLTADDPVGRRLTPGYRALFAGPPGTGKTLVAALIGKAAQVDVYRIDLSRIASAYISETTKALDELFDRAEARRWILLVDEADALLGRRSDLRDAHDRFADAEVAHLWRRIEAYRGLVIFAIEDCARHDRVSAPYWQSVVRFALPDAAERLALWQLILPADRLAPGIDLAALAHDHALSPAGMINVLRFAAIRALDRPGSRIVADDLERGTARESRGF